MMQLEVFPVGIPTIVTTYSQYQNKFGAVVESGSAEYTYFTSISAYNYFQQGGDSLLVTRVVSGSYTSATSSTVAGSDIYFDFTLPSVSNLFDPAEIKASIDESRIVNHSQGAETLAAGCIWAAWGVAVQSPGVVRVFLRSSKNNTSGQANFFTINLSLNSLI